jgi:non-ribosomal peptide synthetase component F
LIALYSAYCENRPSLLPELALQYADYVLWEREWMQGEVLAARLSYWKEQLGGKLPVLQLPADRPRPAVQSFHGKHHALQIDAALTAALKALAQREGATLFMTLLAAFKTLLHYYTKQDELIVATGIANRERPEAESLIGYFATVLPLRTNLAGARSFREVLQRVREVTLGATAHQGLPFARLVQEVQPERDPSRNPIYQAEFTLLTPDRNPAVYGYGMSAVQEVIHLPGLEMSAVEVEGGISRFDLAVFIWDLPQGLCGTVEYGTDLFERATIARMIALYERLLQLIVAAPQAALSELLAQLDLHFKQEREAQAQTYKDAMQQKLKGLKTRAARTVLSPPSEEA